MKFCYKCEKEKNLCDFSSNKNKQDGLNSECKECQKKYFSEYYSKNKDKHIERVKKVSNNKKKYIAEQKLKSGCSICGYNKHPAALHFHHKDRNTKNFGIANHFNKSIDSLIDEISKCEILCANCHAEKHAKCLYLTTEKIPKISKNNIDNIKLKTKIKKQKKEKVKKQILRKSNIPKKEDLEKLLWEIPTTKIAEKFKVSDKTIEKWAKKYNLSKPPRGYWSRNKDK